MINIQREYGQFLKGFKRIAGTGVLIGALAASSVGCGGEEATPTPIDSPSAYTSIVFDSDIQGNGDTDIYIMDINGGNRKRLTTDPNMDMFPSLSSSGEIAFSSGRHSNIDIYVMDLNGKNLNRLTNHPAIDLDPSFSPDGTKIAFYSLRDGNEEIYVMNADGSNQRRLTNDPAYDMRPSWSLDGKEIYFDSTRNGNSEIYIMNADGSNQRRLTNDPGSDVNASCSIDGKIAFDSDRDGVYQIFLMDTDGKNIRKLTSGSEINAYPTWLPDENKIIFVSARDGKPQIYSMNANGSNQRRITDNNFVDMDPSCCLPAQSQQKDDDINPEKVVYEFQDSTISCIIGEYGAEVAALYILETKNTYEKDLHDAVADLYLLDRMINKHTILSSSLGDIDRNSDITAMWRLESRTEIGTSLQFHRDMYHMPLSLIFIRSDEGVFEVESNKMTSYFPRGDDMYQPINIELIKGTVYKVFEEAGVSIPK